VKKRWYQVKDGIFSWYHLEERQKVPRFFRSPAHSVSHPHQDINCEPNGQQEMASVVEIMGYSTSPDLQRMFKYCFVFQCSDGQRFQFGVRSLGPSLILFSLGPRSNHQTKMDRCSSNLNGKSLTRKNSVYVCVPLPLSIPHSCLIRITNRVLLNEQVKFAKSSFNKQVLPLPSHFPLTLLQLSLPAVFLSLPSMKVLRGLIEKCSWPHARREQY
jgi:hypothetical protein